MTRKNKPLYKHDCNECVFLGIRGGEDVYVHLRDNRLEIVSRWGNGGSEYRSGIWFLWWIK